MFPHEHGFLSAKNHERVYVQWFYKNLCFRNIKILYTKINNQQNYERKWTRERVGMVDMVGMWDCEEMIEEFGVSLGS